MSGALPGGMCINKTLLALTLSVPTMLACGPSECGATPDAVLASHGSGSASVAFDPSASVSGVEQGTLTVAGFTVANNSVPAYPYEVTFNLGHASSLDCMLVPAGQMGAGPVAFADFCPNARLTLGGAQAVTVDMTGVSGTVASTTSTDSSGNVTTNVTIDLTPTAVTTPVGTMQVGAVHLVGSELQVGPNPPCNTGGGGGYGGGTGSWT